MMITTQIHKTGVFFSNGSRSFTAGICIDNYDAKSLPFSLSVLGGSQLLTLEAPLIAGKAPCMYNGYIYSKDDVRSPSVKPPWFSSMDVHCTLERRRDGVGE
jgi:hypothetical protein